MPRRARASGGCARRSVLVEHDLAGCRRQQAHDALEQRRLAHAVAAHQARARAASDVEIDVPQGVAAAVELIQRLDLQHAHAPEIHFDDARIVLHLIHVAFRQHAPFVQHRHASAIDRTKSMSCSTTTTDARRRATPAARRSARFPAASCRRPARRPAAARAPASAASRSRATASGREREFARRAAQIGQARALEHLVDALALRRRQRATSAFQNDLSPSARARGFRTP